MIKKAEKIMQKTRKICRNQKFYVTLCDFYAQGARARVYIMKNE